MKDVNKRHVKIRPVAMEIGESIFYPEQDTYCESRTEGQYIKILDIHANGITARMNDGSIARISRDDAFYRAFDGYKLFKDLDALEIL